MTDARDTSSPPSPPPPVAWDGPVEDDGLPPIRVKLAKEAALLFQSRRFAECVDVLKQLLQKRTQGSRDDRNEEDPKVLHNIAVAEYFRDDYSDPRKLLSELDKVKKKSEDLARTSLEQLEAASSTGSNIVSGSRGSSSSPLQLSTAHTTYVAYVDEFDTSIVAFNIAAILYHLHEYKHALSVLWPLYQRIEPIAEPIALHICLLLLDIALALQDASTAADVIQYLEKKSSGGGCLINPGDNGNIFHFQSSSQGLKISSATSNITAQDSSDLSASANFSENLPVGNSSDDALEFENLYSRLDGGAQNLRRAATNDLSKTLGDWVAPAFDLNLKIHLYKVRFLLLTRNQKATKREVKLAMTDVRGRDSSTELVLKSQLEYRRCNHSKAIRLLQACGNRTEPTMQIIFINNLGCIYHQLGKHNISNFYFSEALKASSLLLSEKPWKLSTYSQNKSRHIVYNCGLQSLVCGNTLSAARFFHQAAPIFDNRPLFWLRSAECCLLTLKKGLLRSSGGASCCKKIKLHVVGSGRWRQLVIDDSDLGSSYAASTAKNGSLTSDEKRLSLPFARQCLLKALVLLDNFESKMSKSGASISQAEENQAAPIGIMNSSHKNAPVGDSKTSNAAFFTPANANEDSKEMKGGQISNTTLRSSVAAYAELCRKENHIIKQAVLGDLAYVELCLEEPSRALYAAKLLQNLPDCSRMYVFLSRVYAAEALCILNRLQEAAEQLSVYIMDGSDIELPYSDEDRLKWSMMTAGDGEELKGSASAETTADCWASLKPEEAHGALCTNLASMFAMKGDLEQAGRFAKEALSSSSNNPRATLAAVYLDLKQGRQQDALFKLRHSKHVIFLATLSR